MTLPLKKPRLALIPGDPHGIGPELIAKLLASPEIATQAHILLIGDAHIFERGQVQSNAPFEMRFCDATQDDWTVLSPHACHPLKTLHENEIKVACATEPAGRSVLQTLDVALDFAQTGRVDGIVFAPFNKEAMHLAGIGHDDELHYMAEHLKVQSYISEINTFGGIWTSRVTSHIPLRNVGDMIDEARICQAVSLLDTLLKCSGIPQPRISVAALNPHGGDGGNFGREEIDVIRPAVEKMAAQQIAVDGPWPSDTVFLKAKAGEIDAVVTMYHDQGQIALKLMGFERGVTVQGGLPFPVTTPAHGTAFDIAGQGLADVGAIKAAFDLACDMVVHWK